MKDLSNKSFNTISIHAGEEADQYKALTSPIYMTSTFTFDNVQQGADAFDLKNNNYIYTRLGNPTINLLENRIAALSGGVGAIAFASGMAAVSSVLLSLAKNGDEIVAHRNLYGCTYTATAHFFPEYGIKTHYIDMTDLDNLAQAITPKTKCVYLETPTNPSLEIIDIRGAAEIAHEHNIPLVIDNTFATPYFQRPFELGADIVVHSATKYFSGHGDLIAGLVVARDEEYLLNLRLSCLRELGGVISPFNAWLILRGLKTLGLRMKQHEANAKAMVDLLEKHPNIEKIMYPGLPSHPNHDVAKTQMSGFGGILSFELKGDYETARTFVESLALFKLAVSLGDAETLVEIPAVMTHSQVPKDQLADFGLSAKTIRVSAGLEDTEDLLADLQQALDKI